MNTQRPMAEAVYIVTDIECDGPTPGRNSMIAFASVAVTADGAEKGVFEAVLEPLPGAERDPDTYAWFQTQPEAWAAATLNPRPADKVMTDYVDWIRGFPVGRVFTAFPIAFDGSWIDFYLRRFTPYAVVQGHYAADRLFDSAGLCLSSFAAAVTGRPVWECEPQSFPPDWLGNHEHTHRAIDDARGYAHLLGVLMRMSAAKQR
jgi:hypothetical protein